MSFVIGDDQRQASSSPLRGAQGPTRCSGSMEYSEDHAQIAKWAPLIVKGRDPQAARRRHPRRRGHRRRLRRADPRADRLPGATTASKSTTATTSPTSPAPRTAAGTCRSSTRPPVSTAESMPRFVFVGARRRRPAPAAAARASPRARASAASPSPASSSAAPTTPSPPSTAPRSTARRQSAPRPCPCRTWTPATSTASAPCCSARTPASPPTSSRPACYLDLPAVHPPVQHHPDAGRGQGQHGPHQVPGQRGRQAPRRQGRGACASTTRRPTDGDWELITAGQRVQIIKKDPKKGGVLQFGTEVIAAADGTIGALLGASPGASTAVPIMIELLQKSLPARTSRAGSPSSRR